MSLRSFLARLLLRHVNSKPHFVRGSESAQNDFILCAQASLIGLSPAPPCQHSMLLAHSFPLLRSPLSTSQNIKIDGARPEMLRLVGGPSPSSPGTLSPVSRGTVCCVWRGDCGTGGRDRMPLLGPEARPLPCVSSCGDSDEPTLQHSVSRHACQREAEKRTCMCSGGARPRPVQTAPRAPSRPSRAPVAIMSANTSKIKTTFERTAASVASAGAGCASTNCDMGDLAPCSVVRTSTLWQTASNTHRHGIVMRSRRTLAQLHTQRHVQPRHGFGHLWPRHGRADARQRCTRLAAPGRRTHMQRRAHGRAVGAGHAARDRRAEASARRDARLRAPQAALQRHVGRPRVNAGHGCRRGCTRAARRGWAQSASGRDVVTQLRREQDGQRASLRLDTGEHSSIVAQENAKLWQTSRQSRCLGSAQQHKAVVPVSVSLSVQRL
jgi:hypothetical protein